MNDGKHYHLTEELAQEISGADKEDQLFAALANAAGRMGFDHFALAFDRRGTGDPASIRFCETLGLDYVSCSAYRVPIARLAAAQAALGEREKDR